MAVNSSMVEQQLQPCQKSPMFGVSFRILQPTWLHYAHSGEAAPSHLLDTMKPTSSVGKNPTFPSPPSLKQYHWWILQPGEQREKRLAQITLTFQHELPQGAGRQRWLTTLIFISVLYNLCFLALSCKQAAPVHGVSVAEVLVLHNGNISIAYFLEWAQP